MFTVSYSDDFLRPGTRVPTPEDFLLAVEEDEQPESSWEEERRELALALGCAHAVDREILYLSDVRGLGQVEIGQRIGLGQSSVCNRLTSLRRWLALVVPRRIAMRRTLGIHVVPESLVGRDAAILDLSFWQHLTQQEVAHRLGCSQGMVGLALRRLAPKISTEVASLLPFRQYGQRLWSRPPRNKP